jgi:hypothetical protein
MYTWVSKLFSPHPPFFFYNKFFFFFTIIISCIRYMHHLFHNTWDKNIIDIPNAQDTFFSFSFYLCSFQTRLWDQKPLDGVGLNLILYDIFLCSMYYVHCHYLPFLRWSSWIFWRICFCPNYILCKPHPVFNL